MFVFPKGLVYFQQNLGHRHAVAIAGLISENPGVITIANSIFELNPGISGNAAYEEGAVFVEEAEDREKQLTEAVKEDCREVSDGGSLLLHCQEWGLYELSHELICSSLWPINSKGCQREKRRCREM
ncbi:hypothetical protein Acr_13g0005610 [Actinidia rufa]|uniref:Cupin type-1 domain-containing protein n=1 Tax=Actinidia rufa TaxID=165716 RepID=A0A7J0FKE7_9ERIC|nr:hypothetical protein Acr_13g0005610 [Actinidia rufa]